MADRKHRRRLIRQLLQQHVVSSQEQLVELAPEVLQLQRYQPLPPQSVAKAPPLFLSIFMRRSSEESTRP